MRLGAAYHQVGELGDAERHTRHATFIDPHFVMAFLNLAQIHDQVRPLSFYSYIIKLQVSLVI